jgi:hypothetical protein
MRERQEALAKEYTNPRVHVHILERSEDNP